MVSQVGKAQRQRKTAGYGGSWSSSAEKLPIYKVLTKCVATYTVRPKVYAAGAADARQAMALFAAPQTLESGLTGRNSIRATVSRLAPKEIGKPAFRPGLVQIPAAEVSANVDAVHPGANLLHLPSCTFQKNNNTIGFIGFQPSAASIIDQSVNLVAGNY